jgi:hypothetical protein
MRGNSTFKLLPKGALFAFSLFLANQSFAQQDQNCTVIVADFNTNENGFTSTQFNHILPSNGDGHMQVIIPRNINTSQELTLTSDVYGNPSPAGSATYGFTLSGYVQGTEYQVRILNSSNAEIAISERLPVNPNSNANAQTSRVCQTIEDADLHFGLAIKYEITIFSPDPRGNGGNEVTVEFDDFSLGNVDPITLPVNFIGFHGKKAAKGTQLTWNVADEINVSRYEVQRGSNAGDLKTIGIVFSGEKTSYTFTDEQPSQGITFYRIRSVDNDGKFKYSTVISFSNGRSAALLRAYPMPARNQVTLQHDAIEGKAQISISSEDGRIVKRVTPATGSMQTSIDLSALKAGLYLLRLENSNGEVETLKLVKQ